MRIWITGIGIVSPLAADRPTTMRRLLAGDRAQRPVSLFDTAGCRSSIAAEVDLRVADVAPKRRAGARLGASARTEREEWSRTDAMALCAAREALAQAGCEAAGADLVIGGTTAGMFETEELLAKMHAAPGAREPLSKMLTHPLSATADRLCEALGAFRRAATICSACSSGANALIVAAAWLAGGAERVLVGGADGLCRLTYTGFSCLGALSPSRCRPFDVRRDGLNLGEGAGFLLLETESAATLRGAAPIAELRGWAAVAEAHHITNPEPSGAAAAEAMRRAIARAGLSPEQIGYVNAHGTATRLNDAMEAAALGACFGPRAAELAVSSSKGAIGHTLGAAGAIEAAITALAVASGDLPPTAGLVDPDPDCPVGHLQARRACRIDAALSSSFGFGGSDVAVVLARPGVFDEPGPPERRRVFACGAGQIAALDGRDGVDAGRLDPDRARRLDRAARLATVALMGALEGAPPGASTGAIVGGAYGSIDDCAAFVHRFIEKGARLAPPAVFPGLLPSSPVAHASIYLGLRGAVLSCHDLAITAESAMILAIELCAAGEADCIAAGGVEPKSALAEAVLAPLFGSAERERGQGAAVLRFEAGSERAAIAEVAWWRSFRGGPEQLARALSEAPAPRRPDRALLCTARAPAVVTGPWGRVPRRVLAPSSGAHDAAGGFAAAAALSALASSSADEALVVGEAPDRGAAILFRALDRR